MSSHRALPRVFLPGAAMDSPVELPREEFEKLHKVLRLKSGDRIAVLPNDGSLWTCRLEGRSAVPEEQTFPKTESEFAVTLLQALPKADRLETSLRMGTEIGVRKFVLFSSERSVVRWEPGKLESKLLRFRTIIREAAEQSFRSVLPELTVIPDLKAALAEYPDATVLSEREGIESTLWDAASARIAYDESGMALIIGPEGGWAPHELEAIGDRGVTLGPLVLRTDTAGPAAAAAVLFGAYAASRKNSFST
ncbi:MAG TPA: RsmE family RNA methyltransferase [Fimbriimonadaceae bacterium]|nr:RsmE family RNA methyltransferase [Fimbriimonadaceae bacterium]